MIKVLFFARIREQLGIDGLTVQATSGLTVAALREQLIDGHDTSWGDVLGNGNIIKAVNHVVVDDHHPLSDGDEVAFFPPVTGG